MHLISLDRDYLELERELGSAKNRELFQKLRAKELLVKPFASWEELGSAIKEAGMDDSITDAILRRILVCQEESNDPAYMVVLL